jgi:phage/plasmid primase-like uncharacterized protein
MSTATPEFEAWVARGRSIPIEDELARRGVKPAKGNGTGIERKYPCPHCGGDDRFGVNVQKQTYVCHQCGAKGGGAIDFVTWIDKLGFLAAVEQLTGEPKPTGGKKAKSNGHDKTQIEKARSMWRMGKPAYDSPVETYLRARGITCVIPATTRFLSAYKERPPAMMMPFGIPDVDGGDLDITSSKISAIHLTYLREDGSGKADIETQKITIASPAGKPIVIAPIGPSGELVICEGIEDALTIHQAIPGIGVWAAGAASFMPHLADAVPDNVTKLVIYEDANDAGRRGARKLAQKLCNRIKVFLENNYGADEYPDVNDVLRSEGEDAVRLRHANAREYDPERDVLPTGENIDAGKGGVSLDDFRAYMPAHNYIYVPSREPWPASSVNSKIKPIVLGFDKDGKPIEISAATWLDRNRSVEQMTWAPGKPMLILNRLISEGGWIDHHGVTCFNLYRPPTIQLGDASKAGPWLDLIKKIYPAEASHIINWCAAKVQHPEVKINHAIVLGGPQGIGKDTWLEPVKRAIGHWNFKEESPEAVTGRFNGFLKSVILRINEARDTGDTNRYQFYEHTKVFIAAPPDVLQVDEKHLREHSVLNCCGVIITTNHKTDGLYLPADDRRHFVAWSNLTKDDFTPKDWNRMWAWYNKEGGDQHVAAYLNELDISEFDSKAPPPKTPAFWAIVDAGRAPEDAELADVLDAMDNPDVTTLTQIRASSACSTAFEDWLKDTKNRRVIPHRMESCGYVALRNDRATDGLWKVGGKRQVVYAKATLSIKDQHLALKNSDLTAEGKDTAGK